MSLIGYVGEKPASVKVKSDKNGKNAEVTYVLRGYPGAFVAHDQLKLLALGISTEMALRGLTLSSCEVEEHRTDQATGLLDYLGVVTFTNGDNKEKEEGDETISWSTIGGTEKIQQAISQQSFAPSGKNAPNVGNGINVTADNVEGVEQPAGKLEFTINHWFPPSLITDDYIKFVNDQSGKTNMFAWRSFPTGDLLFHGGQAEETSLASQKPVKVSFKFSGSPSAENIEIVRPDGNNIMVPFKEGWEYLWIMHDKEVDQTSKTVVMVPKAAYVAQTKYEFDFAGLGLRG